jgi:prephenate dehydratase
VVTAVARGDADAGALAIENSVEGAVAETLDLLIHETELRISGEIALRIQHHLLARPGTRTPDVTVVYSHPQALAQCRKYLETHLPHAHIEASLSTVAGVERAMKTPGAAAIASERAAELFCAEILASGIQDRHENTTRFVIVSGGDAARTGNDKTSLAFKTPHDRPGTLVAVLNELSRRGINLTKIESRPSKDALGVYVFLVDLEGHQSDPIVAEALASIAKRTSWLKRLGSYPRRA